MSDAEETNVAVMGSNPQMCTLQFRAVKRNSNIAQATRYVSGDVRKDKHVTVSALSVVAGLRVWEQQQQQQRQGVW